MNVGFAVALPLELMSAPIAFVGMHRMMKAVTGRAENTWGSLAIILLLLCTFGYPFLGMIK